MNTLDFEKDLVDKLAEIGSQLRRVREGKSISIEQVAATTLIRPRLLRAIEDGKLEHLPEPIYIQGFIRRFADALGLDGIELASSFPTKQASQPPKSNWKELPAVPPLRPIHLYLLYIALIIAAVSGLSYFINRSAIKGTPSISTVQPLTPVRKGVESQPKASSLQTKSPTQAASTPTSKPVQVNVILKAESWIQVKVDGKTEFEGILPSGTQRSWTAGQQLVVRSGNAGGVLVSFNDAPAKPLGEPGTIKTVTFDSKSNPASTQPLIPSAEQ